MSAIQIIEMVKFIELHYKDCEICFNFDHVLRFTPVACGKQTCLTFTDNSSVVVEEKYAEVKALLSGAAKKTPPQ